MYRFILSVYRRHASAMMYFYLPPRQENNEAFVITGKVSGVFVTNSSHSMSPATVAKHGLCASVHCRMIQMNSLHACPFWGEKDRKLTLYFPALLTNSVNSEELKCQGVNKGGEAEWKWSLVPEENFIVLRHLPARPKTTIGYERVDRRPTQWDPAISQRFLARPRIRKDRVITSWQIINPYWQLVT